MQLGIVIWEGARRELKPEIHEAVRMTLLHHGLLSMHTQCLLCNRAGMQHLQGGLCVHQCGPAKATMKHLIYSLTGLGTC